MAIKPDDLMFIKNIFWDVTTVPTVAMVGNKRITSAQLNKKIASSKVSLMLPVSPPKAGTAKMNIIKTHIKGPVTISSLFAEIYKFYNEDEVDEEHGNLDTYAKLMDGQTLFMGMQYMEDFKAYYVHLMRRTAAGVLEILK